MDDCIFCKLANGVFPTATLYEDDDFRVILDLGPASKGHALVLPKQHYANLYEIPDELLGKAMAVAKKCGARLVRAMNADGLNIVQNNGEAAGQTVFHFHIHLIPRYKGEEMIVAWKPGTLTPEDRDSILARYAEA